MDGASIAAHIFFGTLGFGLVVMLDFVLVAVARTRRAEVIRTVYEATARYGRVSGILFLLAILGGIHIAIERHFSLAAGWLLLTYALIIVNVVVSVGLVQRRSRRILAVVHAANASQADLDRVTASVQPVGAYASIVAMAAIVALMVLKPGL